MKKLILNILLLALLLAVLSTVVVSASPAIYANNGITYLADDPDEPHPEAVFTGCDYEDPNGPHPESI